MKKNPLLSRFVSLPVCLASVLFGASSSSAEIGDTKVLKWKDGKEAAFLLSFDDSCPTHLSNVIPELEKRGIVGNFYIVPGKGAYTGKASQWEKVASSPVVALQNHTFTHVGSTSVQQLDEEFGKCNEVLKVLNPDRKWPRLIGYGQPGGVPWEVSKEDVAKLLEKHHLVDRPGFYGPPIHQKSAAECIATIDKSLETGEMGHLDMHGVGGDWLVTPMEWFTAILDKLDAEKERIWVTDVVSYSQYVAEREGAKAEVLQVVPKGIRLSLIGSTDPEFYDLPLTLESSVPTAWKQCTVKQGETEVQETVEDGIIRYSAIPGKGEIRITVN